MAKEKKIDKDIINQKIKNVKKVHKIKKKKEKKAGKGKRRIKFLKMALLVIALFLINIYILLNIFYKGGDVTISLDYEEGKDPNLLLYESPEDKSFKTYLKCEDIDFLSDVSIDWIPDDINDEADGSHHGHHFIAYTFYAENIGKETINYWTTAHIESFEKNVDDAVRFMVYKNGERTVYAKRSAGGGAEPGTVPFIDEETIMLEKTADFKPGDIDKYTIVVFLEGDDPQCKDHLIGGEIVMNMTLTEEHITYKPNEENINEINDENWKETLEKIFKKEE
ncbi:MAG: hypothetical protein IKL55_05690 [Clostridia bacterium]|nr:hypothetical protein [Clostridia bacterium]